MPEAARVRTAALQHISTTSAEVPDEIPLSQGVRVGDLVFVSGQVGRRPDGVWVTDDFENEVRCTLDNVKAIVEAAGGTLESVCRIGVFLTHAALFDRFNAVYRDYFREPRPARSTIITGLGHPDLHVEVEAIASVA